MGVRPARLDDVPYIVGLHRKETDQLGFVPQSCYEREIGGMTNGTILIYEENRDPVGFIYATHNRYGVTKVHQIAIQEDARRMQRASALVGAVERDADWLVSLRCAADLDAADFWETIGFQLMGQVGVKENAWRRHTKTGLPTRRGRQMLSFQKIIGGLWGTPPGGSGLLIAGGVGKPLPGALH
jgi:N-acetylglutamate synthase-like GNAT family acetyltransferase